MTFKQATDPRSMRRQARALESGPAGASIEVEINSPGNCARCASGQGCGSGLFNVGMAPVRLQCQSDRQVTLGDDVVVEFSDTGSSWLWLVCGAYGLPTAGLLTATMITAFLLPDTAFQPVISGGMRDLWLAMAGVAGLTGGVIAWRMMTPRVLLHLEKRLGLQTGRIVATGTIPRKPATVTHPNCSVRENP